MKLLYVAKQLPFGETEAFILPEIASHQAAGWDVWLAPTQSGALVHEAAAKLLPRTIHAGLLSPKVLAGFAAELARAPATVLRWGWIAARSGALSVKNLAVWPKGVWLGRRVRELGIDHLHLHWASVPATMGMIAAAVADRPFSITAHRYDIAQGNLLPLKAKRARFIRAIDEGGAQEIRDQIRGSGAEPWLLRMGVQIAPETAPVAGGVLQPIRLVMGARFMEKKGHRVLFDALARLREAGVAAEVDLFGNGPLQADLQAQVERLALTGSVRFCGVAPHEVLLEQLRSGRYHAAVLPSLVARNQDKEGIPVFLMEAMAAGLPAISTPNGGIGELARGGACLLVPEGDAQALADAIARLARDYGERRRLAEAGRRRVVEEFQIETCMARLRARIAGLTDPGAIALREVEAAAS
jgi:glycosyltransferase involved in cell wall biosynthesis